jgi:hypothetical protein
MRAVRNRRSKAGAMESLTVIILAVAAIVIAAGIWAFLNSTVGMQQTSADFAIQTVEVRAMSNGQCNLFVVLRNTGGQQFSQIRVELRGPGGTVYTIAPSPISPYLSPGQAWSSGSAAPFTGWACPAGWGAGTSILVTVELTTPSGLVIRKNVNSVIQFGA